MEIIESLGPFDWTQQQDVDDGFYREIRPIVQLENGAMYQGEWLVDG